MNKLFIIKYIVPVIGSTTIAKVYSQTAEEVRKAWEAEYPEAVVLSVELAR